MITHTENWGIHWFRRDLRIAGNPALDWNLSKNGGRVVGLFCFDAQFLDRPDFSANRFAFFLATLTALRNEMQAAGGDLWVIDCLPRQTFEVLLESFKKSGIGLPAVSFNRDYEPFARQRDAEILEFLLEEVGVQVETARDHLLIEPSEIGKPGGKEFYQIYTPFARRWFEQFRQKEIQSRLAAAEEGMKYLSGGKNSKNRFRLRWKDLYTTTAQPFPDALAEFERKNFKKVTVEIPRAGSTAALERLELFSQELKNYGGGRDIPGIDGTSKMSIYLKNGSITTAQMIVALGLNKVFPTKQSFKSPGSEITYLKELVWREFYYSILYHEPAVETLEFREKYRALDWENDREHFGLWQEGRTGFPIVDAGMRQLKSEGWMHNRVRMIVASFLTKDLIVDWRWGEKHFMHQLLDGDLANNNGGWQWAASTGCDPQPYFRIFNPLLQSQRFDPEGHYIRRYVPELAGLSNKQIHAPDRLGQQGLKKIGYPAPLVNHASQKLRTLQLYTKA